MEASVPGRTPYPGTVGALLFLQGQLAFGERRFQAGYPALAQGTDPAPRPEDLCLHDADGPECYGVSCSCFQSLWQADLAGVRAAVSAGCSGAAGKWQATLQG